MNIDDTQPSATVEEAIERYTATVDSRIAQLAAQRDHYIQQLQSMVEGFDNGEFVCNMNGLRRMTIARAALLNSGVYGRLEAVADLRSQATRDRDSANGD